MSFCCASSLYRSLPCHSFVVTHSYVNIWIWRCVRVSVHFFSPCLEHYWMATYWYSNFILVFLIRSRSVNPSFRVVVYVRVFILFHFQSFQHDPIRLHNLVELVHMSTAKLRHSISPSSNCVFESDEIIYVHAYTPDNDEANELSPCSVTIFIYYCVFAVSKIKIDAKFPWHFIYFWRHIHINTCLLSTWFLLDLLLGRPFE